jgi:hypothetical protein
MKAGRIAAKELQQTKAMIANQLREIGDSAFEMIGFDFNRVLSGKERTTSQLIAATEQMEASAIQAAAETFHVDMIYFLRNREEV